MVKRVITWSLAVSAIILKMCKNTSNNKNRPYAIPITSKIKRVMLQQIS
jgi:hypothetical protein